MPEEYHLIISGTFAERRITGITRNTPMNSPNPVKTYADAETKARDAKLGFRTLPSMTPAWDFRAAKKTAQETEKANRIYLTGTKGGCYYINSNGNKTYVKKALCN